jgi:two-component system, response regulator PdtaR
MMSDELAQAVRVLLVEDDFLIASAAETALRRAGHEIVGMAPSSARALQTARRRRPQLCVVDVNLADGASGVQFAVEAHRALGVRSLFVTSDPQACRSARPAALGCLLKPYGPDDLARAVAVCEALMQGRDAGLKPPSLELFEGES